jgi:hypothetical protein
VNPKAAGISTKSADQMDMNDRMAGYKSIDIREMDRGIADAERKLEAFKLVHEKADREEIKKESQSTESEGKRLKKEFVDSMDSLVGYLEEMKETNVRDIRAARTAKLTGKILENTKNRRDMR